MPSSRKGIIASDTSASPRWSDIMMVTMATIRTRSATRFMAPAANISCSTSTSVVMRVITRPTGLRSK